jgi:hypothetical protein
MKRDKQQKRKRRIEDTPRAGVGEALKGAIRQALAKAEFRIPDPGVSCDLLSALPPLASQKIAALQHDAEPQALPARSGEMEVRKLLHVLADVTTGIWRMRRKMAGVGSGSEVPTELRAPLRHLESTWDILAGAGVEVGDPAGQKYVNGMALRVIAFQPTEGVQIETIDETIKPTVFYKKNLIQMGEVIVATPVEANRTPETPQ